MSLKGESHFYKFRAQNFFKRATSINYVARFTCRTLCLRGFLATAATYFGLCGYVHGNCDFAT
jgi:hypothetical protein